MSENMVNREAVEQAIVTSVGSKIFGANLHVGGIPTQVLCSACRMSTPKFMVDYEGEDGFFKIEERYKSFDTHAVGCFFNFDRAEAVGDYAVYTFLAEPKWVPLKKLESPVASDLALAIFRELIALLANYKNSSLNQRKYNPLLFICKESVYVSFDADGRVSLRLLPMRPSTTTQYPGLPNEVFGGKCSIASDIFMAAYLYLELKYPEGEAFRQDEYERYDLLAERCISPFIGRRYSLEELLEQLSLPAESTPAKADTSAEKSESRETGDTSYVFHTDSIVNSEETIRPRKKKPSIFQEIINRKKAQGAKKVKKIKGKWGEVNDRFDDFVSTEQGDDQEND